MATTKTKASSAGGSAERESVTTIDIQPLLMPIAVVLAALILGISMVIAAGRIGTIGTTTTTGTTTTSTGTTTPATGSASLDTIRGLFAGDYVKFGNADSKVLFVEVADPSCPYCHIAGGKNPELNKEAGAQFTLVADGGSYIAPVEEMRKLIDEGKAGYMYIYSPGHGAGEMAMKALYCAYEKGKFWEAHDILMTDAGYSFINDTVANDKAKSQQMADFIKAAVDPSFTKSCLDSGKYDARLTADTTTAASIGISGTPGFYVNDKTFAGAYSWTEMKPTVDAALQ